MKTRTAFLLLTLFFAPFILLMGQQNYQLTTIDLTVEGTSTLHDWVSSASQITAKAEINLTDNKLMGIPSLQVKVPVKGIKSTKGRIMDNKTYDALKAEEHANIQFKLSKVNVQGTKLQAEGLLTIAGKTKTVKFPVEYTTKKDGQVQFKGAYDLLMSDYEVEAPTALMGSIKTGDAVTIRFDCTLALAGSTSN